MSRLLDRFCVISTLVLAGWMPLWAETAPGTIPLEVAHGRPFVMVMVNGKGPFRFVVDTGTGGEAFVTPELADQLNLPSAGEGRVSDPSGQGSQRVPIVMIQSLKVAGVEFTGIRATRHKLSDENGSCKGLLGFVLFRNYLLTLDYPKKQMTVAAGSLAPDGERSVLPFRMPDGIPIVPLNIAGMKIDAQIDSGGAGLSLPEGLVPRLRFSSIPIAAINAQSLSTRFQIKSARLDADVSIGEYTFARPFVEINPAFPLANFGSSPMQNFVVTFDQKNALVRFESSRPRLHLSATPTPIRIENAPVERPLDASLVPIG
jgi:predicted aspartyl protease